MPQDKGGTMVNSGPTTSANGRPSLGTLVSGITGELRTLVRGEIELAKAELRASLQAATAGGAMLAVAAVLLGMVWLLATWAAVYGLVEGADLPVWASFLIVAGVYLVIAIVLGIIGVYRLKRARGPQVAVAEMQRTKQIVEAIPPNTPRVPETVRAPPAYPF
jgi:hypothetical protein